jgi:uncharacterized delta-60 repeat protein
MGGVVRQIIGEAYNPMGEPRGHLLEPMPDTSPLYWLLAIIRPARPDIAESASIPFGNLSDRRIEWSRSSCPVIEASVPRRLYLRASQPSRFPTRHTLITSEIRLINPGGSSMIANVFRNHHDRHRHRSIRARRAKVARPLLWDSLEDRRLLNAASLDPTFGKGGVTTTDFPLRYAFASATSEVIDSSGRIIVAGYASDADGNDRVVLARYNPNGSLDPSFGNDGLVYTPIGA